MFFFQEKLIQLKCFSMTCNLDIVFYEESIVPLLYRMLNLEELFLNLPIDRDAHELFIDVLNSFLNSFIKFVHYLMCFIKSFFYLI
jgi:hypothetical protein